MTSNDDNHDPPTAVGAGGEPTTIVPAPDTGTPALAWSLDDQDDAADLAAASPWREAWAASAPLVFIVGLVAFVIAVTGWVWMQTHTGAPLAAQVVAAPQPTGKAAAPAAVPSTVTGTVAAPSTPAISLPQAEQSAAALETSPPPAAPPTPLVAPREGGITADELFLSRIRSEGWNTTDAPVILRDAHEVCRLFRQGESPNRVNQELIAANAGMNMTDALQFTSAARLSYPDC